MSSSALRRLSSARWASGLRPRPQSGSSRSGRPLVSIIAHNFPPLRFLTSFSSSSLSSSSSPSLSRSFHVDGCHPSSPSSISLLTFPELSSYATHFLTTFYDAPPPDSRATALALLSSLHSSHPTSPAQHSVQTRLIDSLHEVLGDVRAVHDIHEADDQHVLDAEADNDDGVLLERVVAQAMPSLSGASIESVVVELHEHVGEGLSGEGGKGVGLRFDERYSTDQMLVDSLPTLDREEIEQIGRRDVSRLLGN